MKETPILFTTENVQKIEKGLKWQTRRVIKPQPIHIEWFTHQNGWCAKIKDHEYIMVKSPCGQVGDRLWVRETWCYKIDPITAIVSDNEIWYKALNPEVIKVDGDGGQEFRKDGYESSPWISPLFMPKWAARIWLEITRVRVERVQDISEEDAQAEGIKKVMVKGYHGQMLGCEGSYVEGFARLWDSINLKRGYGWQVNPWVWVYDFKRVSL